MTHDALSDVLSCVRLRGAVYFDVTCLAPWSAAAPPAAALADVVMPGAERVIAYHLVTAGGCWAWTDGLPPVRLEAGDVVLFPHGDAHMLASAPGQTGGDVEPDWLRSTRAAPKPIPVAYAGGVVRPGEVLPAAQADAVVVCGFLGCDLRPRNPLVESLPRLLLVRTGAWVAPVLHQAVAESRARRAGSAAVLERLSEMVFVDAVRHHLEHLPAGSSGWFAALRDPHVGRAIGLLHADPAAAWTVEQLALRVGSSRSVLHQRFVALVGQPPMQYLAQWRIQRGAQLLRSGDAKVAAIAQEVGYQSEAAFARAFKRLVGVPPAAWRAQRRPRG